MLDCKTPVIDVEVLYIKTSKRHENRWVSTVYEKPSRFNVFIENIIAEVKGTA